MFTEGEYLGSAPVVFLELLLPIALSPLRGALPEGEPLRREVAKRNRECVGRG